MQCASFFSGIGGFELGFEQAGIKTVFQCEKDPFCIEILKNHWPKTKKHFDINQLEASLIPNTDIWCGGFPCQDVSVARGWLGRDGLKGKNTGLFYPFVDLIKAKRPQIIIMENVSGLLNSHDGKDFAVILQSLTSLGYGVAWRILNTRYFGAPQSRPRVFICAWKGSPDNAYHVLFEEGNCKKPEKPREGFLRPTKCQFTGATVPEVAFCLAATSGRHTGTDWSRSYVTYQNEVRRLTPTECERIQGLPVGWTKPDQNLKISKEKIDSLRYKAIGNAVSVPVVEWIGKRVEKKFYEISPTVNTTSLGIERFAVSTPKLGSSGSSKIKLPKVTSHTDAPKIKWASAGVLERNECIMGPVSQMPQNPIPSLLVNALDKERPDLKYFLSPNAAKGILRRVNKQGRKLFHPLSEALYHLQCQQ